MNIEIKEAEVLRYLGYKNQEIDKVTQDLIRESMKDIKDNINPRSLVKEFKIGKDKDKVSLEGTSFALEGRSIYQHLKDCHSCLLLALSLGHSVDRIIRYYERVNMAKVLILDASASAAIEDLANKVTWDLEESYKSWGQSLTSRFSPGYGDLSLDLQKNFLDLLDAPRTIGLTASSHNILIPRKSVTAIIGVAGKKLRQEEKNCKNCNKYETCNFTRGVDRCGN